MRSLSLYTSLLFTLLLSPLCASASMFLDTVNHPHAQVIEEVARRKIAEGYGYGIFRPDIYINRAEFLKILMLASYGQEALSPLNLACFSDFVGSVEWYWVYACAAKERGIIDGYPDGTFRGNETINLAEAMKITVNAFALEVPPYVNTPQHWYLPYFAIGGQRGLFSYFPYDGSHLLTRSEMAYLVVNLGEELQDLTAPTYIARGSSSSSSSTSMSSSSNVMVSSDGLGTSSAAICGNGTLEFGEQCDDGNTQNSDGCSEACIIVLEPVRHASLRLDQRPIDALSVSVGAKNVTLFAFDAIAGRQDLYITLLKFQSAQGSLNYARNYALWTDTNNDGIVDYKLKTVSSRGEVITFNGLNQLVPDGSIVRMEVRADISKDIPTGSFSLSFNFSDPRFVLAQGDSDGRELSGVELNGAPCSEQSICWIAVNAFTPQELTIVGRGTLYVSKDTKSVPATQVLASTESGPLTRIALRADGEDIEITEMNFIVNGSIDRLIVYEEGNSVPIGIGTLGNCTSFIAGQYCVDMEFRVKANQETRITVHADVLGDTEGGKPGVVSASLIAASFSGRPVRAFGVSSQDDLSINNGNGIAEGEVCIGTRTPVPDTDIVGTIHETVFAKISAIDNVELGTTTITTGTHPIAKFRFAAADHNNTSGSKNRSIVQSLVFKVFAQNVQFFPDSFAIYNNDDSTKKVTCTGSAASDDITVTCSGLDTSSLNTAIDAGKNITLVLEGLVLNAHVSNTVSTVQVSLIDLGDSTKTGTVQWTDESQVHGWVDIGKTVVRSTVLKN